MEYTLLKTLDRKMEFSMCPASGNQIDAAHLVDDRAKFPVKEGNVSKIQPCHAHFLNQEIPFFV